MTLGLLSRFNNGGLRLILNVYSKEYSSWSNLTTSSPTPGKLVERNGRRGSLPSRLSLQEEAFVLPSRHRSRMVGSATSHQAIITKSGTMPGGKGSNKLQIWVTIKGKGDEKLTLELGSMNWKALRNGSLLCLFGLGTVFLYHFYNWIMALFFPNGKLELPSHLFSTSQQKHHVTQYRTPADNSNLISLKNKTPSLNDEKELQKIDCNESHTPCLPSKDSNTLNNLWKPAAIHFSFKDIKNYITPELQYVKELFKRCQFVFLAQPISPWLDADLLNSYFTNTPISSTNGASSSFLSSLSSPLKRPTAFATPSNSFKLTAKVSPFSTPGHVTQPDWPVDEPVEGDPEDKGDPRYGLIDAAKESWHQERSQSLRLERSRAPTPHITTSLPSSSNVHNHPRSSLHTDLDIPGYVNPPPSYTAHYPPEHLLKNNASIATALDNHLHREPIKSRPQYEWTLTNDDYHQNEPQSIYSPCPPIDSLQVHQNYNQQELMIRTDDVSSSHSGMPSLLQDSGLGQSFYMSMDASTYSMPSLCRSYSSVELARLCPPSPPASITSRDSYRSWDHHRRTKQSHTIGGSDLDDINEAGAKSLRRPRSHLSPITPSSSSKTSSYTTPSPHSDRRELSNSTQPHHLSDQKCTQLATRTTNDDSIDRMAIPGRFSPAPSFQSLQLAPLLPPISPSRMRRAAPQSCRQFPVNYYSSRNVIANEDVFNLPLSENCCVLDRLERQLGAVADEMRGLEERFASENIRRNECEVGARMLDLRLSELRKRMEVEERVRQTMLRIELGEDYKSDISSLNGVEWSEDLGASYGKPPSILVDQPDFMFDEPDFEYDDEFRSSNNNAGEFHYLNLNESSDAQMFEDF